MADPDNLDETSESIAPINNAFGLPGEFLAEILREFDRACRVKNISTEQLQDYLDGKGSWKVKSIALGSVSNAIIRYGEEGEQYLPLLNSIGEDSVTDELIRMILAEPGASVSSRKVPAKKSTTKGVVAPRPQSNKKTKDRSVHKNYDYESNGNSGVLTYVLLICAALLLCVGGIIYIGIGSSSVPEEKAQVVDNTDEGTETNEVHNLSRKTEEVADSDQSNKVESQSRDDKIGKTTSSLEKNEIIDSTVSKTLPPTALVMPKDGMIMLQKGQPNFRDGTVVGFSDLKKNDRSPFLISKNMGRFAAIHFQMNHIDQKILPSQAIIMVHFSLIEDKQSVPKIYLIPIDEPWDAKAVTGSSSGLKGEWGYSYFSQKKDSKLVKSLNLRIDWVTFDVTGLMREHFQKGKPNYGFVLLTENEGVLSFNGFDFDRSSLTPKLVLYYDEQKDNPDALTDEKIPEKNNEVKKPDEAIVDNSVIKKEDKVDEQLSNIENIKPDVIKEEKKDENLGEGANDVSKKTSSEESTKSVFEEEFGSIAKKETAEKDKKEKEENAGSLTQVEKPEVNILKPNEGGATTQVSKAVATTNLKAPVCSMPHMLYQEGSYLTITNPNTEGTIRYTLDGSEPSSTSDLYRMKFQLKGLTGRVKLKMGVFLEEKLVSPVASKVIHIDDSSAIVIDNSSSNLKKSGNWEKSKLKRNYYGRDYFFSTGGKGSQLQWIPNIPSEGEYEIYVWLPDGDSSRVPKAEYKVISGEKTSSFYADHSQKSKGWVFVGKFFLEAGRKNVIKLEDDGASGIYVGDAIALFKVE